MIYLCSFHFQCKFCIFKIVFLVWQKMRKTPFLETSTLFAVYNPRHVYGYTYGWLINQIIGSDWLGFFLQFKKKYSCKIKTPLPWPNVQLNWIQLYVKCVMCQMFCFVFQLHKWHTLQRDFPFDLFCACFGSDQKTFTVKDYSTIWMWMNGSWRFIEPPRGFVSLDLIAMLSAVHLLCLLIEPFHSDWQAPPRPLTSILSGWKRDSRLKKKKTV